MFVVYDIDDRKNIDIVGKHDMIGQVECTLADIVTAGQKYKRTLRDKGKGWPCQTKWMNSNITRPIYSGGSDSSPLF